MSSAISPPVSAALDAVRRSGVTVNHFVGHLAYGDAVSFDAVNKWRELVGLGVPGGLFVGAPDDYHRRIARPLAEHRTAANELAVLHYSVWSEAAAHVMALPDTPVLFVYHNITPTRWFEGIHRQAEEDTRLGRSRLPGFAARSPFAVADSEYNRRELEEVGFAETGVVPILVDFDRLKTIDRDLLKRLDDGYVNVLSVGRLAPNKCHEDTIKTFYHYKRQIEPRSRLIIAGPAVVDAYRFWLMRLVQRLGLEPHVLFPGHITNEHLATYYRSARAYATMSEHEGFCVPLLEAMHAEVPVLAFDSTAVPFTMGDAGVLISQKEHGAAAEALGLLTTDTPLRRRMIEKGRRRVAEFSAEKTRDKMLLAVARALRLIEPVALPG